MREALDLLELLLLAFFLDVFSFLHANRVPVVQTIPVLIRVDLVRALTGLLHIKINFDLSSADLLAVHLEEGSLSGIVGFKSDVAETLRLLSLPVVAETNGFDLAESAEAVTDIIFFEGVRKAFNEKSLAISGHRFRCLVCLRLAENFRAFGRLDVEVSRANLFTILTERNLV